MNFIDVREKRAGVELSVGATSYFLGDILSGAFALIKRENKFVSANAGFYNKEKPTSELFVDFMKAQDYDMISLEECKDFFDFIVKSVNDKESSIFYSVLNMCENENTMLLSKKSGQILYAVYCYFKFAGLLIENPFIKGKIGNKDDKVREVPVVVTNSTFSFKRGFGYRGQPVTVFEYTMELPDGDIVFYAGKNLNVEVGDKFDLSFTIKDFRIINGIPTNIIMRPKIHKEETT